MVVSIPYTLAINYVLLRVILGFPCGTSGKEPSCQCRRQEMWVQSLHWEDPLEKEMAINSPIFLPGESHGQRSLVCYTGRRVTSSWT